MPTQSRSNAYNCRWQAPGGSPDSERRDCDWPGCGQAGEYRAPKSRDELRNYYLFCLDHVRMYNKSWDYFAGMSRSEIEAHLLADVTWHRPTWRIGGNGHNGEAFESWRDPFGFFADDGAEGEARAPRGETRADRMLAVLNIERGAGLAELKRRYKQLAKLHHPDLHGGDKQAEERLKLINEAYTYLLDSGMFT